MKFQIEKFILPLRILICILLILLWSLWIITLPDNQSIKDSLTSSKKSEITVSNTQHSILKKQEEATRGKLHQQHEKQRQTPIANSQKKEIELPKLVDLKIEDKKTEIKEHLDLPKAAEATRKTLTQTKIREELSQNKNSIHEIILRKKITAHKEHIRSTLDKNELDASWLPKYIKEKQRLTKQSDFN